MTFLYKLLIAIPMLIGANIILGVAISNFKHTFDKEIFKRGLMKGALIYTSIAIIVVVGYILPELAVNVNGVELTLFDAIVATLWAVALLYAKEVIEKFIVAWNLKANEVSPIDSGVVQIEFKEEIEVGDG